MLEQIYKLHALATQGIWTTNCASEIFVDIDGEPTRIGHFNGCAADAEAACAMHNNLTRIRTAIDGSKSVSALPAEGAAKATDHELGLAELVEVIRAATPEDWSFDASAGIHAVLDGVKTRIGSFQGCVEDARVVCAIHNAAEGILNALIARCEPSAAEAFRVAVGPREASVTARGSVVLPGAGL